MPSLYEQRFQARAIPMLNRTFGVSVTFIRGIYSSAEITARRNDVEHKTIDGNGIPISITMRDFVLPVDSVVIDGDTVQPRTGDRIMEGTEVFEIQPPDENKLSVELQAGGYEWICHTKRVE
jgi:hypothetical protein